MASTEKMHREALHSGLHSDLAHMIKKWPVNFDLL